MTDVFDLDTRQKIYRLIAAHPGLNLSTIAELLHLSVPLVDYHTLFLEQNDLIAIVKEGGFKRYYLKDRISTRDRKLLGVLRQETPLRIVLFLLDHPCAKHKDILKNFNLAPSTLTYHLEKLVKNHVICLQKSEEDVGYILANEKELIRFLVQYNPSKVLKRFKETWADDFRIP